MMMKTKMIKMMFMEKQRDDDCDDSHPGPSGLGDEWG